MLTAKSINSMDKIVIIMFFLLSTTPRTPVKNREIVKPKTCLRLIIDGIGYIGT